MKHIKLLLSISLLLLVPKVFCQSYFEDGMVRYYQVIFPYGNPYIANLSIDSFQLDSIVKSNRYYSCKSKNYGLINGKMILEYMDTSYFTIDSTTIYFTGREMGSNKSSGSKSYKKAKYFELNKKVGDSIFIDFEVGGLGPDKKIFSVDSVFNQSFYGKNRKVFKLKYAVNKQLFFIEGIGYSLHIRNEFFRSNFGSSDILLHACSPSQLYYWADSSETGWVIPFMPASCNFDTIANEFAKYHTASNKNIKSENIKVFPNPANMKIKFEGLEKNTQISIFNISGQLVYSTLSSTQIKTIEIDFLPQGMYMVKFENNLNTVSYHRFIKN